MCKGDSGCYILARVAAQDIPADLVLGWHSAIISGCYSQGLSEYTERAYKSYVRHCEGACAPLGVEEWLQNYGYHVVPTGRDESP